MKTINVDEVLTNMLGVIKGTVKEDWRQIKDIATEYLQSRKRRIELLVNLRLNEEISEEFFLARLEDEKVILESELLSISIVSKAIAQKAANAALDVLQKAVEVATGL